jgi:hypothetical protein
MTEETRELRVAFLQTSKKRDFHCAAFHETLSWQQRWLIFPTGYYPNRSRNMEIIGKNPLRPKVKYGFYCMAFHETHCERHDA